MLRGPFKEYTYTVHISDKSVIHIFVRRWPVPSLLSLMYILWAHCTLSWRHLPFSFSAYMDSIDLDFYRTCIFWGFQNIEFLKRIQPATVDG